MYCIDLRSNDPSFNLALEEILLKKRKEDFLILGINNNSIIVGKHQVAHREVNTRFVFENNVPVFRRLSGGGTVFHDAGNLNFTFILQSEKGRQIDFRKYTLPVINFLSAIGVDAKFEGKNDLKVDGFKISGNAEHVSRERILHHGTLLFDSSLEILRKSIRKDTGNYSTRAVKSNPSPVINLKSVLKGIDNIFQFKSMMMEWFIDNLPGAELYVPDEEVIELSQKLAETKYLTWDWNYAYGPEYSFSNIFNADGTEHKIALTVKDGIIVNCLIEGTDRLIKAAGSLTGCRHMVSDIINVFSRGNINITKEEIFYFF
jgi:lipoate---protein ligase